MTKNHDYATPPKGTNDWHIPLNDNFSNLDTDVEVRDAETNLGSYSPKTGSKFLATDTGNVYLGDGSQWNKLGAISGSSPSNGSSSGFATLVSTNDSIQEAVNNLPSSGGMIVLEEGTHSVNSTIERNDADNVVIVGQGKYNTQVRRTGDFPLFRFDGSNGRIRRWEFHEMKIQAGGQGSTPVIDGFKAHGMHFVNVRFEGYGNSASTILAEHCYDWRFHMCRFAAGGRPGSRTADVFAQQGSSNSTNHWIFTHCHWEVITSYGVYSANDGSAGSPNGRFRFSNCKFHAHPNSSNRGSNALIGGDWHVLLIANSTFTHSDQGYINVSGEGVILSNIWTFRTANSAQITGSADLVRVSNSFFRTEGGEDAINLSGDGCGVVNCAVRGGGNIVLNGNNTQKVANVVF